MKKLIAIITLIGLTTASLKSNDTAPKKPQEQSSVSSLIVQRFLKERASSCNKKAQYNQDQQKKLSTDDKIFETPSCEVHDMAINVKREECDGQESVIIETKVFGSVDDFEDAEVIEAEKRLLKFVLIKAYQKARAENKEKNKKENATLFLDANTKVTIQPAFLIIKTGYFNYAGSETKSEDRKGMQLLTVFSKADFDALAKQHFNA